jgi:hypothetical protein
MISSLATSQNPFKKKKTWSGLSGQKANIDGAPTLRQDPNSQNQGILESAFTLGTQEEP